MKSFICLQRSDNLIFRVNCVWKSNILKGYQVERYLVICIFLEVLFCTKRSELCLVPFINFNCFSSSLEITLSSASVVDLQTCWSQKGSEQIGLLIAILLFFLCVRVCVCVFCFGVLGWFFGFFFNYFLWNVVLLSWWTPFIKQQQQQQN